MVEGSLAENFQNLKFLLICNLLVGTVFKISLFLQVLFLCARDI